ncbi:hypothetical protein GCM10010972_32820 [Cellulomonas carbonis]|nr:hypothetical protein GCM10010972_32820 [Cellulomonas carbonis]
MLSQEAERAGARVRTVYEGDPAHPADHESVAWLPAGGLDGLLDGPTDGALDASAVGSALRAAARPADGGLLVPYGLVARDHGPLPEALAARLRERDVYEQPLDRHVRLRTEQWAGFVADAATSDDVWVLDCCFLQNPLTMTVVHAGAPEEELVAFVGALASLAAPLEPVVVHLRRDDVDRCFRAAAADRPREWLDAVVGYYTSGGLGRALGVTRDVAGAVEVLRHRAALEERVLDRLGLPVVAVDTDRLDQDAVRSVLADLVAERVRPGADVTPRAADVVTAGAGRRG